MKNLNFFGAKNKEGKKITLSYLTDSLCQAWWRTWGLALEALQSDFPPSIPVNDSGVEPDDCLEQFRPFSERRCKCTKDFLIFQTKARFFSNAKTQRFNAKGASGCISNR